MSVGFIQGPVKLYENTGNMQFVEKGNFTVNGKVINASDGGPCIVDWDGDGILDLFVGDGMGNISLYKGRAKGSLDLTIEGNGLVLPTMNANDGWTPRKPDKKSPVGFSPARPGVRVKPYAADWNGDGKLDLLVGDYIQIEKPAPKLTAKQKKELAALEKRQKTLEKEYMDMNQRIQKLALEKVGKKDFSSPMSQEEVRKYSAAFQDLTKNDKKYKATSEEFSKLYMKIRDLKPGADGTGFVWVYLRK